MSGYAVAVLSCHDGCGDGRGNEINEVFVGTNDGCGVIVGSLGTIAVFLVRSSAVELLGLCGKGSQADGDARGLEVCGIKSDDTDNIVVVWL